MRGDKLENGAHVMKEGGKEGRREGWVEKGICRMSAGPPTPGKQNPARMHWTSYIDSYWTQETLFLFVCFFLSQKRGLMKLRLHCESARGI